MKKWICFLFLCLMALSLTGCSAKDTEDQEPGPEDGVYQIYYLNSALTKLVPQPYETENTDPEKLVSELVDQIISVPQDVDCQVALPEKVGFISYRLEQMVLYLYFDNNYTSIKPTREILCRAALVKTLTQVDGVDYVNIYVGDQPLLDTAGNPVGMMSASDFLESVSDVNVFEKTDLVLYFADSTGEKLIQEKRKVVHNVNTSVEKLVLEQLIDGPQGPGYFPTLSKDIKVLNVSVNENVCYINFDPSFLSSSLDVSDYIPIYSIVNSLSELPTVNKVQISVNGSQDVMYRDSISLNQLFERNLDYIGGTED